MTILVGLLGSDGVVLAADKRFLAPARSDKEMDDRMHGRKIVHLHRHKVAYAFAGDWYTEAVGKALSADLDAGTFAFDAIENSLDRVAKERYGKRPVPLGSELVRPRALLVGFYGLAEADNQLPVQLWNLKQDDVDFKAHLVDDVIVTGARGNAARFFEHYFVPNLLTETLKFLAAHIVLAAHEVDSGTIDGLDIAVLTANKFNWITEKEKSGLRVRSRALDNLIRAHLFT